MTSKNPWGLRPFEAKTIDAVCDHGNNKATAQALGLKVRTVENYMANVREAMGGNRVHCMRLWLLHRMGK